MISVVFFMNLIQKKKDRQKKIEVFLVSITDIKKVLISQKKSDLQIKLLDHYHKFLDVFDCIMTEKLFFLRGKEMNHHIELKEIDEKKLKML